MTPVTVYTRAYCPYCTRALALLEKKGVSVNLIDASGCPVKRQEMIQRSGRWTFPQIFIGERHVGGCDDLHALEQRGALDPMLAGA
jgi:glutaredoxin 3